MEGKTDLKQPAEKVWAVHARKISTIFANEKYDQSREFQYWNPKKTQRILKTVSLFWSTLRFQKV